MSSELPFRMTFTNVIGKSTTFESAGQAMLVKSALRFHLAGGKGFHFEKYIDGVYVTDHDAEAAFKEKTAKAVTGESAVPSLMQLEQTAGALHRYANKKPLQPEHLEKLLTHSLAALKESGVSHEALMLTVLKSFPEVAESLRKLQIEAQQTHGQRVLSNSQLEQLAHP